MIRYEDECNGCKNVGLPCQGGNCKRKRVKHIYCDNCGEDVEEAYDYYDNQFCAACVLAQFYKFEVNSDE